jgi:transposase-like protein
MTRISDKWHRFPVTVIQHAVWLCFGFTLSLRDVEEMLVKRGIDISCSTTAPSCSTIRSHKQAGGAARSTAA